MYKCIFCCSHRCIKEADRYFSMNKRIVAVFLHNSLIMRYMIYVKSGWLDKSRKQVFHNRCHKFFTFSRLKRKKEPGRGEILMASIMKNLLPGLIQPSGLNVNHIS